MTRYFYDTEFLEDGRTIELVSIGVVAEDGREYYACSTEFDPARAIPWVAENVLPHLPPASDPAWRTRAQIRDDLAAFLTEGASDPELWAWIGGYDHVVLCQLWGGMPALPAGPAPLHPRPAPALGAPRPPRPARDRRHRARRAARRPARSGPVRGDARAGLHPRPRRLSRPPHQHPGRDHDVDRRRATAGRSPRAARTGPRTGRAAPPRRAPRAAAAPAGPAPARSARP